MVQNRSKMFNCGHSDGLIISIIKYNSIFAIKKTGTNLFRLFINKLMKIIISLLDLFNNEPFC